MIKVEIGQYRIVDKGALKAFFTLVIYPHGQKIIDCRYFIAGDNEWFKFPEKEIKKENKPEYLPIISFLDKKYLEELKKEVLIELRKQPKEKNVCQGQTSRPENFDVQGDTSALPF